MRTVEMKSWTESRLASPDQMGHAYDITSERNSRALSPVHAIEVKNGMVHVSSASDNSSVSEPSDSHSR
jgi:hypothetical protein